MVTLDDAINLAHSGGIEIRYTNFSTTLLGIALWYPNKPPVIGLDNSLWDIPILHKEILAEEIGHIYTGAGNNVARDSSPFRDRCLTMKCENQGLMWQLNYLVPLRELEFVLKSGMREIWELSDHFQVSHKLMWKRVNLYDVAKIRFSLGA